MIVKFDETPGIAGVYLQVVRETREYYVGESKDVAKRRKSYSNAERGGRSCNRQPKLRSKLRARFANPDGPQFEFWVLETGLYNRKERLQREIHWDEYFLRLGYARLNTAPTGGANPMESAECRAKVSAAKRGKRLTAETRAKMSAAKRGKKKPPRTAEHRARLADAARGRMHTAETRAKMSNAKRGKALTTDHRAKLSEAKRKYWAARKAQTNAECNGSSDDVA